MAAEKLGVLLVFVAVISRCAADCDQRLTVSATDSPACADRAQDFRKLAEESQKRQQKIQAVKEHSMADTTMLENEHKMQIEGRKASGQAATEHDSKVGGIMEDMGRLQRLFTDSEPQYEQLQESVEQMKKLLLNLEAGGLSRLDGPGVGQTDGVDAGQGATDQPRGKPKDCSDVKRQDESSADGVYSVVVDGEDVRVFCDMTTAGGGWTVMQRRMSGGENFFRSWDEYRAGFGQPTAEYWLGNDRLHQLTAGRDYLLYVQLEDQEGLKAFAQYSSFQIGSAEEKYRLRVSGYNGSAGDALDKHDQQFFSTKDRDNDGNAAINCAEGYRGGWWYYPGCVQTNLNGLYQGSGNLGRGVTWLPWRGNHSLKRTEMKMRPKDFVV
ncbi:microfibril-associated glycoprotein 4-like isoform X1 [Branchiostoma lanceolatum]|uniref:microfibril-associated glycoprotein 4-like isoform X1 n=1 Tax=Branchiostoma lanceolatum TaxID=7740 RepID=UPI0034563FB4